MAERRPSSSLADGSRRAGQSGRRPYNRPASRLADWPVIIRAGHPHEHAGLMARRCAGYALGAANVNGERVGNPHQLRQNNAGRPRTVIRGCVNTRRLTMSPARRHTRAMRWTLACSHYPWGAPSFYQGSFMVIPADGRFPTRTGTRRRMLPYGSSRVLRQVMTILCDSLPRLPRGTCAHCTGGSGGSTVFCSTRRHSGRIGRGHCWPFSDWSGRCVGAVLRYRPRFGHWSRCACPNSTAVRSAST